MKSVQLYPWRQTSLKESVNARRIVTRQLIFSVFFKAVPVTKKKKETRRGKAVVTLIFTFVYRLTPNFFIEYSFQVCEKGKMGIYS